MQVFLLISFLLVNGIQLFYHYYFFLRLITHREPPSTPQASVGVSVVVAARNEQKNLRTLVERVMQQEYPAFELIIVNDRSDDNTEALLEELSREFPLLRHVTIETLPEGWSGKKNALKTGITLARYEIILLTDADCVPVSTQWIRQIVQRFEPATAIVLGFSPYAGSPTLLNQFIRLETLWTGIQYLSFALAGLPYMGVGRNMAYRKSLFGQDGFKGHESVIGGDDDLFVNRKATPENTAVALTPSSQTLSRPEEDWHSYFRQKIRHLSAGKHYHKKDQTRLGIFALSMLAGWALFLYLLITEVDKPVILTIFAARSLSFYSIFTLSGRKLKLKLAYWILPAFDLYYTIYYLIVGSIVLTTKRTKWS